MKHLLVLLMLLTTTPALAWEKTGSWDNIKTEEPGFNGVACFAWVLAKIRSSGYGEGMTHFVFVDWWGKEAVIGTTDEELIQLIEPARGGAETFLTEYWVISVSSTHQVFGYLSRNGRTSSCVVDRKKGRATWSGEI